MSPCLAGVLSRRAPPRKPFDIAERRVHGEVFGEDVLVENDRQSTDQPGPLALHQVDAVVVHHVAVLDEIDAEFDAQLDLRRLDAMRARLAAVAVGFVDDGRELFP
jgi:hypothetical protein